MTFRRKGASDQMARPAEPTDEELVARARKDPGGAESRRAASELLRRYSARVYGWCRGYVRDPESAMDLAQEVLWNAYRGLPEFGERSRFSSWLFAIARNRCISASRRSAPVLAGEDEAAELADPGPSPETRLLETEDEEQLREFLREHLGPLEQDALWLRYVERVPVEEITAILGIRAATGARGVLQTARRKLRVALSRRSNTLGGGSDG